MGAIIITGITLDAIGTILIAYTALKVHDRVRRDHHIDSGVVSEMGRERTMGIVGIAFIIIGYIFQVVDLTT